MGITKVNYEKLSKIISEDESSNDKIFLELGIQESQENLGFKYIRDVLSSQYKEYISIDLHDINNVTICDLSEYHNNLFSADIITNFGTSEHVEYEEGQYNCWKNIHNWLKLGGIVIHEIPEVGSWPGHCRYYVDEKFFKFLENYGYSLIEFSQHSDNNGNLAWCVLKKIEDKDFMDYNTFIKNIHVDYLTELTSIHTLNNPKNLK